MEAHPYRSPDRGRLARGFTIIEVLIAAFILSVGLLAAAALIGGVIGSTARSEYMNQAATLASEKLEQLNQYPSVDANVAVATGSTAGSLTADTSQTVSVNGVNELVNYYDEVYYSTAQGTLDETNTTLNPNGNGSTVYATSSHPPTGIIPDPPTISSTPPNLQGAVAFHRRWLIEGGVPVQGVERITVVVTLLNGAVQPPVQFQMSIVRPGVYP